jgi:NAD(P)-dependent dehydrogenase (short-subunit alcohol dehydrogenase family)
MAENAGPTDRKALVTGASRGIGAATAELLAAEGWTVVAPSRDDFDLSSRASIDRFLADEGTDFDGLVLNAGMNDPQVLSALELSTWDEILQVDLSANVALVKAVCPGMAARGFGRVVAVSSGLAGRTMPGRAAYSAAKAGLESMIRSVAVEFGAQGVVANAVAPGIIMTEMQKKNMPEQVRQQILPMIPAARFGEAEDVAAVIAFLMNPRLSYVNGVTIPVDGGFEAL